LHSSEEEYYTKSQKTGDSDEEQEDVDMYDFLKLAKG